MVATGTHHGLIALYTVQLETFGYVTLYPALAMAGAGQVGAALALCESVLGERGAWRIHGGGFGGTVQAFVPDALLEDFRLRLEAVFGAGSCHVMQIRSTGFTQLR